MAAPARTARRGARQVSRAVRAFDVIEASLQQGAERLSAAAHAKRDEADALRGAAIAADVEAGAMFDEADRALRVARRVAELTS